MTESKLTKTLLPIAQIAFIAVAAGLVFQFVTVTREGELRRRCTALCTLHPEYAGADRKVPSFTLKDMKGQDVAFDSLRGKTVVLNFWTKTCGPCMQEMPAFAELAKVLKDRKDVAVLTISMDEGPESVKDILKTVLREEPPFPVLFDPDGKVVGEKFGTHLFPETWIIDERGVIRARFDGARDWSAAFVTEFIDQIRNGGYCPVEVREGAPKSGEGAAVCKAAI